MTIYTDAGWKEGRCRVGYIARGTVHPCWKTGAGEADIDSVVSAEALAILYALREVGASFVHPRGLEGFFIRSDNLEVVNLLRSGTNPRKGYTNRRDQLAKFGDSHMGRVLSGIYGVMDANNWSLHVRHVRGHGKAETSKQRWMNARADEQGNMRRRDVRQRFYDRDLRSYPYDDWYDEAPFWEEPH